MKKLFALCMLGWAVSMIAPCVSLASDPANDATYDTYTERWAMDIPGVGPVWVGIKDKGSYKDADMLWVGGSVLPVGNISWLGDVFMVTRVREVVRERDKDRNPIRKHVLFDVIGCEPSGSYLSGTAYLQSNNQTTRVIEFYGKKAQPLPPAPDLSKVKYGDPIKLFNGENLDGWKLKESNAVSGWVVEDGVLYNRPKQERGKPHISYGNLQTEAEFEDFNLTMDVNVPKDGNSGVYLRGRYEVQVQDSYGKPLDFHNMGAIYSRITPKVPAEKPAGEWQTLDITLCDRHATVILNGKTIIDNKPLLGVTGGAMTSDESKPGPIYLQGDHDYVAYRNVVLKPIIKEAP